MITLENLREDDYFLPEDGEAAQKAFLDLLSKPTETYISAYGFNWKEAFDVIGKNDVAGVKQHLVLDYVQSQSNSAKPLLKALLSAAHDTDVTLTTAGIGSRKTSQIWHWKGLVKIADDGGEPWCLEGSANFTPASWFQGNSMRVFRSAAWADRFVQQNRAHAEWARANQPHYQPSALSEGQDLVDTYFEAMSADDPVSIARHEVEKWQSILDALLV